MRKKIAFILAMGMILSLCPINTFAASTNTLTKSPTAVSDKAVYVEQGVLGKSAAATAGVPLSTMVLEISGNDDVKEVVEAPYLEIEPKSTITAGSTIKLRLENAKWFFRDAADTSFWYGTVTGSALRLAETEMGRALTMDERTLGHASNSFGLTSTRRTDLPNEIKISGNTYTRYMKGSAGTSDADILFRLTVSSGDTRDATITFPNEIRYTSAGLFKSDGTTAFTDPEADKGKFWIPITVRSLAEEGDVKVSITDNNLTSISAGTWVFGSTSTAATSTYVNDPQSARDEFPIDMLVIQELRVGTMGNGAVEISAPSGYSFGSDFLDAGHAEVFTENFTYSADVGYRLTPADYSLDFKTIRGEPDYSTLVLTFKNLSFHKSNRVAGTVFIRDKDVGVVANHVNSFRLYAEENAGWGDISMRIRNSSGSDIVTNETFVAGTRKDWTMNFFTTTEIPTLVNGRYEDDDPINARDETHLAATIAFNENTVNAWWSGRSTNFSLPDGVKVRKMEITKAKNVVQEDNLKNPGSLYNGYYMNTGKKQGYVTVDGNNITIANLQVTPNKKAELEMNLWLSVASGYEGDITLTATGSAITDDLESIIIAKAINPVQVKSTITDVRIGYQYYPVADVEIIENAPGMLERGKQVWLSVTDRINMDMYFTPGFSYEVTEGNVRIKNVDIATGNRIEVSSSKITNTGGLNLGSGTITFDVDGASSVASTIKFSNLQLKVDRTVPESGTESAYSIYAWGPNIAPNSDVFDYSGVTPNIPKAYLGRDQHSSIGMAAPYVRVVTSATDKNNILSSIVKVSADSTTATVNGNAMTVSPAPFIDPGTNRMQVPVRALATLLGVRDEQIIWSDTDRTVTINMVNRTIQFTIGSDLVLVNGAQVRMDTAAMIVNERTFIPFRYLGDALGVPVTYDDSTRTATFNETV